ncbi:MAG: response regulator [Limisphaerales bacterium]
MAGKTHKLVLCAEDNPDDAFHCQQSARAMGAELDFRVVPDGPSVIAWLTGQGIFINPKTFPQPDVVVLNTNLPGMNGLETLRWIRGQKQFENLPIIIHSASALAQDIAQARQLGATEYIVKDAHCTRLAHYLKLLF